MKVPNFLKSTLMAVGVCPVVATAAGPETLPLAGEWRFQLDPDQAGVAGKWHARPLTDTIRLPGTTDENEKGILTNERPVDRLARVWRWKGAAWYQRDIVIPESWAGKRITLFLERTKHSRLWVNDRFISWRDSLSAPHTFDITTAAPPGRHTLTLLIDNSKLPPVGPSHAVDERTQTNWNGIVGRIELRATDPVWIEDVQVFPDAASREARVVTAFGNITGKTAAGSLKLRCRSRNVKEPDDFAPQSIEVEIPPEGSTLEWTYRPGGGVPLWDEFHPALLELDLHLTTRAGEARCSDRRSVTLGMRDFTREGNRLVINGRPVFLRGRVDCANYPLTGYAPMDRESWRRILRIQKDWGLNHVRFHSWCPPAAAFEVADELGLYLQVELPNKRSAFKAPDDENAAVHNYDFLDVNSSEDEVGLFDYGKREGEAIFRHFGNSPSFTMFTLGNELGMNDGMAELVAHFQQVNPRALHAQGSNNRHWDPALPEGDDFWVMAKLGKMDRPVRGAFHIHRNPPGHVENASPSTLVDYRDSIAGVPVPVIAHETGAYQVSPDFREIDKFTGVLRARNYEVFRDRLKAAGMLDQAEDFVKASGALAAICYREEIEAALRTPEFGGFQLLDIMDFPGQGTAPVGMLDVFMDSKGIIGPEKWREFCSETVPLLRMEKYTWTEDETFTAKVQVAHYGPADLVDATVSATLLGIPGGPVEFDLPKTTLRTGKVNEIGPISLPLDAVDLEAPKDVLLILKVEGTPYRNRYRLWIYPAEIETTVPDGVRGFRRFSDDATRVHLEGGGRVLLFPELTKLPHSVPGAFMTDYWSPMFAQGDRKRGEATPPGTLGLLFHPSSPPGGAALGHFPTEAHSNWQWWHLVKNARPIILDDTPDDFRPSVQAIDNFARNHKLGVIFETRVGRGSMLVCAIDLPALQDKPEARQLLHSLLRYVGSEQFAPSNEIDRAILEKLFPE
ncbi:sugar-binding domain-containing protein [Haloferula sp. A504]|uniref:sugar-binding domain-containing protein n=1 Tax=Haloferula sp. A504 TaxID=3373601 RepID=UPI0031CBAD8A|nr:hypothetical protein [Verrucomicrobiaceae bacterium E54]